MVNVSGLRPGGAHGFFANGKGSLFCKIIFSEAY